MSVLCVCIPVCSLVTVYVSDVCICIPVCSLVKIDVSDVCILPVCSLVIIYVSDVFIYTSMFFSHNISRSVRSLQVLIGL